MRKIIFKNLNKVVINEISKEYFTRLNCNYQGVGACLCSIDGIQDFQVGPFFRLMNGKFKIIDADYSEGIYLQDARKREEESEILLNTEFPYNTDINVRSRGSNINSGGEIDYCNGGYKLVPFVLEHTSDLGVKTICKLYIKLSG